MVKIEGYKSARWYASRCCICGKPMKPQNARVNGTATLMDDSTVKVIYHEDCARNAQIQQACESVKKGITPEKQPAPSS
jgi:hypothetical protein